MGEGWPLMMDEKKVKMPEASGTSISFKAMSGTSISFKAFNKDPQTIKVRKREREAACLQAASPEVTYKQLLNTLKIKRKRYYIEEQRNAEMQRMRRRRRMMMISRSWERVGP